MGGSNMMLHCQSPAFADGSHHNWDNTPAVPMQRSTQQACAQDEVNE